MASLHLFKVHCGYSVGKQAVHKEETFYVAAADSNESTIRTVLTNNGVATKPGATMTILQTENVMQGIFT